MEHGTIQVEALYQKTELRTPIISTIYAAATNDSPETFFVLNADGDNAGLDEWTVFDSDNIAVLKDDEGQKIELHREYQEDGSVHIWFVLNQGQITSFSLPWINGVDRYRAETIVEEIPSNLKPQRFPLSRTLQRFLPNRKSRSLQLNRKAQKLLSIQTFQGKVYLRKILILHRKI